MCISLYIIIYIYIYIDYYRCMCIHIGQHNPPESSPKLGIWKLRKREELNRFILGSDFASNFGGVHCEEDGTCYYICLYISLYISIYQHIYTWTPATSIFEVLTHKIGVQTNQNRGHLGSRHRYDMCIYKLCMLLSCTSSHPLGTGLFITQVSRIIIILPMSQWQYPL